MIFLFLLIGYFSFDEIKKRKQIKIANQFNTVVLGYEIGDKKKTKNILENIILEEDKKKPYTDDKLAEILKNKGYPIARRTIAKYREQLEVPVARLRKKI